MRPSSARLAFAAATVVVATGIASAFATVSPHARTSRAAVFRVGAAVATIDPTYPVYLGGYGGGPKGGTIAMHRDVLTGRSEHLTVRAVAIARGREVVELATVDTQGYMAGYDEGPYGLTVIRQHVASWMTRHGAPGTTQANIVISSLHEHATPTLFGIWGPMSHQVRYLAQVARTLKRVCKEAYARARPATIEWGTSNAPWLGGGDVGEGNEFEGWKRDGYVLALRARDLRNGSTIATYVSQPAYANIVYGPGDLVPTGKKRATQISPDFPWYVNEALHRDLGGVAMTAVSSLSNQASPEQTDAAPSPDLPRVHGQQQTRAFDDIVHMAGAVTGQVETALAHGHVVTDPTVSAAEQYVVSPVDNPALVALGVLDANTAGETAVSTVTGGAIYPVARSLKPPYAYGAALGTWVTGFRIGGVVLLSEPGEFAAPIHWTWQDSAPDADAVGVIGAAQDFLGYEFPAYTTPFTVMGGDELIFNPAVSFGDQVTLAGQQDLQSLGFRTDFTKSPETSITDNDYTAITRPGVHLLPRAVSGDVAPGRGWATTFLAASQVPRQDTGCDNPAFLFVPGGCNLPEGAMGPFHWNFGDGTRLTTPIEAHARAYFSPFLQHVFRRPGTYRVTVSATSDKGVTASTSVVVTIHPALHVRVAQRSGTFVADVTGGDGGVLDVVWRRPDGAVVHGPVVDAEWATRGTTVRVLDGAGGRARVSV